MKKILRSVPQDCLAQHILGRFPSRYQSASIESCRLAAFPATAGRHVDDCTCFVGCIIHLQQRSRRPAAPAPPSAARTATRRAPRASAPARQRAGCAGRAPSRARPGGVPARGRQRGATPPGAAARASCSRPARGGRRRPPRRGCGCASGETCAGGRGNRCAARGRDASGAPGRRSATRGMPSQAAAA